jgi:hypothetical protein
MATILFLHQTITGQFNWLLNGSQGWTILYKIKYFYSLLLSHKMGLLSGPSDNWTR